jgi:hypothetical protein
MHCGAEATHFGVVLSGTLNVSALGDGGARHALGRLQDWRHVQRNGADDGDW